MAFRGDLTSCVPPDENFIPRICGLAFDVLQCPCMGGSHRLRPSYHVSCMATVKDTHFAGLEWYRWCVIRCLSMYSSSNEYAAMQEFPYSKLT